jgi:protein SCO1/2
VKWIPLLLLLPSLAAAPAQAGEGAALVAGVFDPPRPAPDFTLPASDGTRLSLARYRGKAIVLAFGFTSCPKICPTTLATLAQARKKLGARAGEVQVVYVTVDPERDDAERMRKYLAGFDSTFVGATGTPAELAAVRQSYGVTSTKTGEGSDYGFAHSSYTYLIDRDGNLRALMPYGHSSDDYAHDVGILLGP